MIAGAFMAAPQFIHPVLTFKSDASLIHAALEMVSAFGLMEQGRRMAHGALAGECQVMRVRKNEYDIIILPDTVFDMEQHEASVEKHYVRLQKQHRDAKVDKRSQNGDNGVQTCRYSLSSPHWPSAEINHCGARRGVK